MDKKTSIKNRVKMIFLESARLKQAVADKFGDKVEIAIREIGERMKKGGKVILMGNGGSAADAQHMAAELIGRFYKNRRPLPAVSLATNSSILTEIPNDFSFREVFSRQIEALAGPDDIVIGISTSGMSKNILAGFKKAKEKGAFCLGFSGSGGRMAKLCDICFIVPSEDTPRIQEVHITLAHIICQLLEEQIK